MAVIKTPSITHWQTLLDLAFLEDLGAKAYDPNVEVCDNQRVKAKVITRDPCILSGAFWFEAAIRHFDSTAIFLWKTNDGDSSNANSILCNIESYGQALLSTERIALNGLQLLSATATATNNLVKMIAHTKCKLLDTRKTIPGFRVLQKYAVRCGGGVNHRMGLYDAVLLKENHIKTCGSIGACVDRIRAKHPSIKLMVEVETFEQLAECLSYGVEHIMLDNFKKEDICIAVDKVNGRAKLEVSGNIDETNIVAIAETGVDFISVGAITKNIQAIDLSLQIM